MALNRIASLGLLAGAIATGACMSVQRVEPAQYFDRYAPPVVWVTYGDNTMVPLAQPEIRRDTLRGMREGTRVKIPLRDIRSVEAKAPNHAKTALLITGIGVAAISSLYVLAVSQSGGGGGANDGIFCPPDVRGRAVNSC